MAVRRESEPIKRVALFFYEADYSRLQELYADITVARAVRAIIRNHLKRVEQRMAAASETLVPELDLSDDV